MSLESLVATALSDLQASRYASLAASAIIVYDHLITLDQEIEFIWKSRCSVVKYLFFLNRYYILSCVVFNNYVLFTTSLTDSLCLRWFQWQGWTGLSACMIAEVILQMRLYALYLGNKKILAFMIICFVVSSGCAAVIMGTVLSHVTAISELIPGQRFCIPLGISPNFYIFWIPILAFESLLGGLALIRGIRNTRSDRGIFYFGRDLVNILIRDSVLYFLVIVVTYLTNLVVWATQSEYVTEIPIGFTVAMSCVMGNRIILNVRGVKREIMSSSVETPQFLQFHQHTLPSDTTIDFLHTEASGADEMWELRSIRGEAL